MSSQVEEANSSKISQKQSNNQTAKHINKMVVEETCTMHLAMDMDLDLELEIDLAMECAPIGRTVKSALIRAQSESRVIVGLSAAINVLSKSPEGSLFCLMAVPKDGDSATHMHEVLLEAFCYENDIYVIKVDDATKLSRILGQETVESCCLVQKTWAGNLQDEEDKLTKAENQLVDYCEAHWDAPQHPIVQLPAV